ncbi:MAG: THUMP-like domain-containing protein [Phycisphaerales bacterium]
MGAELARGLGLVVAPRPLAAPWFESFEIVEPTNARTAAVAGAIARHGLRARSVRVRGQAVDADAWTRALGCAPSGDAVVFAYRDGHGARVVVTRARPTG